MRRVPRIRLYLRHPPFSVHSFARCISSEVDLRWYLHRSGAFPVLFCSILVLIYAALFALAGVSVLMHECVVVHKRMGRWDRGGISLLNRSEMYGANGLMCRLVRTLYFTQIVGSTGAHY